MKATRFCSIENCGKTMRVRGWCYMHYDRWTKFGDPNMVTIIRATGTLDQRLRHFGWDVTKSGCWETRAGKTSFGYGYIYDPELRRQTAASRAAYKAWVGPIPEGLFVRHRCDNPPCINPEHLVAGTQKQNGEDAAERDRMPRGENHVASKLTEPEVLAIRARWALGGLTQRQLAAEYHVSPSAVSLIVRGRRWRSRDTKKGSK